MPSSYADSPFHSFSNFAFFRFELAYTHTMYYLAQVYKNLGESDLVSVKKVEQYIYWLVLVKYLKSYVERIWI